MAVELNEQLRGALDLLEDSPSKASLMSLLTMPSAHLPLKNPLALRDEFGDRGPWGESLLLLVHHILEAPDLSPGEKTSVKEALAVLWNGHERLSQVASLTMSSVGLAWVPRQCSVTRIPLPKVVKSIGLFLEYKVDRYGISQEEVEALHILFNAGECVYSPSMIHGNVHAGFYANIFYDLPQDGSYITGDTSLRHWGESVMNELFDWANNATRHCSMGERIIAIKMRARAVEGLNSDVLPLRVSELTRLPALFYGERNFLTPAFITTAYALAEEYNEEWAASAI